MLGALHLRPAYPPDMCRWLATAIADSAAPSLPAGGGLTPQKPQKCQNLQSRGPCLSPLRVTLVPFLPASSARLSFSLSGLDHITQPVPSELPEQSSLHPAESLAASLLRGTAVVAEADLLRVHALLPRETPSRGNETENPGFSFSCGCYGKGGLAGLHRNTWVYPWVTKLLLLMRCEAVSH